MAATRVAKTRGAMIILIIRRKMVVITERPSAKAAACSTVRKACAAQPASTPATIEAMTKMLNRRMALPTGSGLPRLVAKNAAAVHPGAAAPSESAARRAIMQHEGTS